LYWANGDGFFSESLFDRRAAFGNQVKTGACKLATGATVCGAMFELGSSAYCGRSTAGAAPGKKQQQTQDRLTAG
jgi:hypothetical protein